MSIYSSKHFVFEKLYLRQRALQHGFCSHNGMCLLQFCPPYAKQDLFLYRKGSFLALLLCTLIYELLQQSLEFKGKSPAGLNGINLYSPPHFFPTF